LSESVLNIDYMEVRGDYCSGALAMIAGVWLLVFLVATPSQGAETREEAVAVAREGRTDEAIAALRKLLAEGTKDPLVGYDLAVIFTWAHRPREATDAFERATAGGGEVPIYVLAPMVRAYRDQKRFAEAEKWAREGLRRYPMDSTWAKLLALVLADENRGKEATELLKPWAATQPYDPEIWLALGYAARRSGDRYGTLRAYGEALRLQPNNREAAEAVAGVLADLGANFGAGRLLPEIPLRIRVGQAGELVRWGATVVPRNPRRRFEGTDAALKRLEALLREARSSRNPDQGLIVRLRRDRVVALRQRERWAEAVAEAQRLRADGDRIPAYVREAEADSLLELRRPREARQGYEEVLRADPGNRNAHIGRYYALVEEENFCAAFAEIDALAASETPGLRLPKQRVTSPNPDWLDTEVIAAEARYFAGMPAAAWKRLFPLAQGAPANADVLRVLAEIAYGRDLPRLSDEEIHIAASLAPDDTGVQLDQAESALHRYRWGEARERIEGLATLFPNDPKVQRAQDDLAAYDSWQLLSEFRYHYEPGTPQTEAGGESPGKELDFTSWLYSPPIAERWRLLGAYEYHISEVTEGTATRFREGAGLDWRLPDFTLEGIFWYNEGSLQRPGGSIVASWAPTDHWTFRGQGEIFAADTPLRAVINGVTADLLAGSIEYTWDDARSLALGVQWYDFSDTNQREAVTLTFAQKVMEIPHFTLTLRPELYTSHNDTNNVPYYSPLRDFSGSVALDAEHLLWREYERSFGQRLVFTAGSYWQQDFGAGFIGSVLYEQFYARNPWAEIHYGVQLNRNIYDGDAVPSVDFFFRVNFRF
jgi:biofilm PGA synthesis protein PgaA